MTKRYTVRFECEPRERGAQMASDKIELRQALAREREVEWLLLALGGEKLVKLTRENVETLGVSSLYESAMAQHGSLEALREKVQERRDLLKLADDFGQPRELVEAELEREEHEGL